MNKIHHKVFHEESNTVDPTPGIVAVFRKREVLIRYRLAIGRNRKLGNTMASWSTLMGNYTYNLLGRFNGMVGTCGNHCAGCKHACYVRHSYFHPSVIAAHAINTDGIRNNLLQVRKDLIKQLSLTKTIKVVRINQSGEIENEDQFGLWCDLATMFPSIHFYVYTKNYAVAEKFLKADKVPANFTINYSIWHEFGIEEFLRVADHPSVKAFVYNDGTPIPLHVNASCPAYKKIGNKSMLDHNITCEKCGLCFRSGAKIISCVSH